MKPFFFLPAICSSIRFLTSAFFSARSDCLLQVRTKDGNNWLGTPFVCVSSPFMIPTMFSSVYYSLLHSFSILNWIKRTNLSIVWINFTRAVLRYRRSILGGLVRASLLLKWIIWMKGSRCSSGNRSFVEPDPCSPCLFLSLSNRAHACRRPCRGWDTQAIMCYQTTNPLHHPMYKILLHRYSQEKVVNKLEKPGFRYDC